MCHLRALTPPPFLGGGEGSVLLACGTTLSVTLTEYFFSTSTLQYIIFYSKLVFTVYYFCTGLYGCFFYTILLSTISWAISRPKLHGTACIDGFGCNYLDHFEPIFSSKLEIGYYYPRHQVDVKDIG